MTENSTLTPAEKVDLLEKKILSLKDDLYLIKFIVTQTILIEKSNKFLTIIYSIFNTIYSIFKTLLKLIFNIIFIVLIYYLAAYIISFSSSKLKLLSYYKYHNNINLYCNLKVLNVPIANKNNTCNIDYIECPVQTSLNYIIPYTNKTFNTTNSFYNYVIDTTKKTRCTDVTSSIFTKTNKSILNRLIITSNTFVKHSSFYFNHTVTCDFTTSTKNFKSINYGNPLIINHEILSTLNHKFYENLIDEVSHLCGN